MSAITGFIDFSKKSNLEILTKINNTLSYRGPDESGTLFEENEYAQIGLGNRRLQIIEANEQGKLPIQYKNFSMVADAEILNFQEIKTELSSLGHSFQSQSDTEVLIHAFAEWGIDCVNRFIGPFAFVIYNHFENTIHLVRDRSGVKPLFYYFHNDLFYSPPA
ncbi:MAG: asparagine synthase [Bacteroidetes bacterium OLB11]|nr:MAG: asparagine synthase [Bacteroidetes bacterium OLB11]